MKDRREGKTHQVALYFMDEDDAIRLRDEMLQMDQMEGAVSYILFLRFYSITIIHYLLY